MNREQKAAAIAEIATDLQESQAVFAVDYRGISVPQAAELRAKLRDADTRFRVVKNTLTERAADEVGAEAIKPLLEGPTALALMRGLLRAPCSDSHECVVSLPITITGSPLRTLVATCAANDRKQVTSIQVVLPSLYSPPLPRTRGVQASRNAVTVPLPRMSTSVPTCPVIWTSASIASSLSPCGCST